MKFAAKLSNLFYIAVKHIFQSCYKGRLPWLPRPRRRFILGGGVYFVKLSQVAFVGIGFNLQFWQKCVNTFNLKWQESGILCNLLIDNTLQNGSFEAAIRPVLAAQMRRFATWNVLFCNAFRHCVKNRAGERGF